MYKVIDCGSFFDPEEVQVNVIDLKDTASLVKKAADERITSFVKNSLKPTPGFMYLHINAMGAGEWFGSNKNGDYFPEENLLRYFKTFETSPAHVFRHHINKDPAKSIGKVIFAIYNERMHRVELIAEVDTALGQDVEAKIAMGMYPQTSMACKTPYDECSICGNRAHTRQEYCSHLLTQMNQYLPDGRRVMAMNVGPLRFFDISIVFKPADITSSVLEKVAHAVSFQIRLSVDEAEQLGFFEKTASTIKQASIDKISELTKTIDEGEVVRAEPVLDSILQRVSDPSDSILDTLSKFPMADVLNAFAEAKIIPTVRFMTEYLLRIWGKSSVTTGLGHSAETALKMFGLSAIPKESFGMLPDVAEMDANRILVKAISPAIPGSSLSLDAIEKRAGWGTGSDNGGFLNWQGPNLPPQKVEEKPLTTDSSLLHSLLVLAGTAFLSRMYIRSLMAEKEEKMNRNLEHFVRSLENPRKIGISKIAEYHDLQAYGKRVERKSAR